MRLMFRIWSLQLLFHLSESTLKFIEEPSNPTYVVKGGEARLRWKFVCTGPGGCATELIAVLWYSRKVLFVEFGILNPVLKILPAKVRQFQPDINFDGISDTERKHYLGRVSLAGSNDTMVILRITEEDLKVNYSCTLVPQKGELPFSQVKLEWAVPPDIKNSSKPKAEVVELNGNPIVLTCEAEGKPAPSIAWVKDGRVMKNTTNDTTLVVNEKGAYKCRVSNMAGEDNYSVIVVGESLGKPGKTTPTPVSATNVNTIKHHTEEGSDTEIMVVAIVAPLIFICLVIGVLLWIFCRKKKGKRASSVAKQRSKGKLNPTYETIQMDQCESRYPSVRDRQTEQPCEDGYDEVERVNPTNTDISQYASVDRKTPQDSQYASVDRKTPQDSQYASVDRKTPQDSQYASVDQKTPQASPYASVDRKTPQESPTPSDEYAQVDMSKKKKKRKSGELLYVELDLAESESNSSFPPVGSKNPPGEPNMYAEVQFDQRPAEHNPHVEESEYSNVESGGV